MHTTGNKRVVFHVGYPKCASTFLQETVFSELERATLVSKRTSPEFISCLYGPGDRFSPEEANSHLPYTNKTLLVSCEGLCGNATSSPGRAKVFFSRIKTLFPHATLLFIVRNQIDFIESLILEWTRFGQIGPMSANAIVKSNMIDRSYLDYTRVLHRARDLFGGEMVKVLVLEDLRNDSARFFDDLQDAIGFEVASQVDAAPVRQRISPFSYYLMRLVSYVQKSRLNPTGWEFSPWLNKRFRNLQSEFDKLYRLLPVFGKSPSFLSRSNVLDLADYYKDSNRRLSNLLGRDLGAVGYPI